MKEEGKKLRKLNDKQRKLLTCIAEYRFMTAGGLADYEDKSHYASSRTRLEALRQAGYIERHYPSAYRLPHKPAQYYLTLQGIRYIKSTDRFGTRLVKTLYNDATASERFIDHSRALVSIAAAFRRLYGEKRTVFPRSLLMVEEFDYFPKPEPDAFVSLKDTDTLLPSPLAFMDYYEDATPIGIHARKIRRYVTYAEDGDWDETGKPFPVILLVCESERLREAMVRRVRYIIRTELTDVLFRVTTIDELRRATTEMACGWIDPEELT